MIRKYDKTIIVDNSCDDVWYHVRFRASYLESLSPKFGPVVKLIESRSWWG
jgi:hypothetical protein